MSLRGIDPENPQNDQGMYTICFISVIMNNPYSELWTFTALEELWAEKAFAYAVTFERILSSYKDISKLRLTKYVLYGRSCPLRPFDFLSFHLSMFI
jgi:hypothetical protein